MRIYPDQVPVSRSDMDYIRDIVKDILEYELPDCETNGWFIASVHFANMLDKMMGEIWENV